MILPVPLHRPLSLALAAAALAPPALPQASEDGEGRPAFTFLRQNEDWSRFEAGPGALDSLKHVDLDDDGDVWVSFGGRLESRYELWENFAFGAGNDDDFLLWRAFAHADLHVGEDFRTFLELKTAQSSERDLPGGRRTLDLDTFEVQQLFVDVELDAGEGSVRLRPGRQMVSLGNQRLVSPLPWGNTLRHWDGLTALWKVGDWAITGLALAFVPVLKTDFNETEEDERLYGFYARRAKANRGLELYVLGNERPSQAVNGTAGEARRQTLGVRSWSPFGQGFDYEVESAVQVGTVGDGDVLAGFASAELGWRPQGPSGTTRLALGLDWASGDDETGGDVGTFDQLYPLGHAYFGFADLIGRQNVAAATLAATWKPTPTWFLRASAHSFHVADTSDAIYNAGGGVLRPAGGFDSSHVADEFDLLARRRLGPNLSVYGGYSHVFAGPAIEESGASEDVDFFYLGLQATL